MGLCLRNATDAPRSSRTGVGHAGAAIFVRSTLGWPLFVVGSAYGRFHVFFYTSKPLILVSATMCFEFPLAPGAAAAVRRADIAAPSTSERRQALPEAAIAAPD